MAEESVNVQAEVQEDQTSQQGGDTAAERLEEAERPSVMAENSLGLTDEEIALEHVMEEPSAGALGSLEEPGEAEQPSEPRQPEAEADAGAETETQEPAPLFLAPQGSRYAAVVLAAKRAKQLRDGAKPLTNASSSNVLTVAMQEVAAGKVLYRLAEEERKRPDD